VVGGSTKGGVGERRLSGTRSLLKSSRDDIGAESEIASVGVAFGGVPRDDEWSVWIPANHMRE